MNDPSAFNGLFSTLIPIILAILGVQILIIFLKKFVRKLLPLPTKEKISQMSGEEFERALRQILERDGWWIELTQRTGDFGADLIAHRDGKKVVIQAKRYSKVVGIRAIQEALGARDFFKADEAWVITNSYFSQAAIKQAKASKVRLKDSHWLGSKIKQAHRTNAQKAI